MEVAAGALFRVVEDPVIAAVADDPPPFAEDLAEAALVVVAEVDGTVTGYAQVDLVGGQPHLEQVSVHPDRARQGIGTALIDTVIAWSRRRGDVAVTLTTFRDVAFNGPMYTRRGFVEVPEAEWSPEIRALVQEEARHGLDPALRLVMQRPAR